MPSGVMKGSFPVQTMNGGHGSSWQSAVRRDVDAAEGELSSEIVRMRTAAYNIHLSHLLLVQIQTSSSVKRHGNTQR